MKTQHWKVGKMTSTVVSDTRQVNKNFPVPPNTKKSRNKEIEYYGGFLVCESIANHKTAKLIAAAPQLLKCLKEAIQAIAGEIPAEWSKAVEDAEK